MKTLFDASSLLNLSNGGLLELVPQRLTVEMALGPQVFAECRTITDELESMIRNGLATLVDDDDIPATGFLNLFNKYGLGFGETECLALAKHHGWNLCCDDKRARRMVRAEVGPERLTGTMGLLTALVSGAVLTTSEAAAAHSRMILRGGFLPALPARLA